MAIHYSDPESIPQGVVRIFVDMEPISLVGAWRVFRGHSVEHIASKLGITSEELTAFEERSEEAISRDAATLNCLASWYNCLPAQLYLHD